MVIIDAKSSDAALKNLVSENTNFFGLVDLVSKAKDITSKEQNYINNLYKMHNKSKEVDNVE